MCGIFGFALATPVSLIKVFKVLRKLEIHQYPQEPKPVGGYGAGLVVLQPDGNLVFDKVGKVADSPAECLSRIVKVDEASVLVGHVRMPSPEFMETASFKETAQPYVAKCHGNLTVVSAHNGTVSNYKEIRKELGKSHVFESERVGLIDSEVIPHLFENLLIEKRNNEEALNALLCGLQGSSAIALLHCDGDNALFHFVHNGKTRGLTVWTNEQNEIIFCSRKEPLLGEFGNMLRMGKLKEKISIAYREDTAFRYSHPLGLKVKG